jgi:hypothetical protein
MKTLLEAIQQYPEQFISTCRARANTTPSSENRVNHQLMAIFIDDENWDKVSEILEADYYRKPLEGVVFCLDTYSEIDNNAWEEIIDLFEEGKFV